MEFQLHIQRRSTDLLRRLACLVSDSEREQSAKKCCSGPRNSGPGLLSSFDAKIKDGRNH